MRRRGPIAIAVWLALGSARAETVEEERVQVQQRLEAERAALEAWRGQQKDILSFLDSMERLSRASAARVEAIRKDLWRAERLLSEAEAVEQLAQRALEARRARLSPRLWAMYRMSRADQAGMLLSARDFAQLIRRSRAMKALVRRDLEELERTLAASRFHRIARGQLEMLRRSARLRLSVLEREAALSEMRRAKFEELLASVQAEAVQSSRVVRELEVADRQLSAMLAEMKAAEGASGFRALRGRLPFPARGLVEVGFGKVVNPKFNTVTVQKGIDLRAPAGTRVVSVAEGTVVFAGWLKGYGNLVIVDHGDGYHSLLAHLSRVEVEVGNEVEEGEEIGALGDTGSLKGAYLYFEIRHRGQAIDPAPWLSEEPD
ncbi:MAG: peptidoglycan DD-metalloendopeptidase family protein [Myxococcales bacterium]|nr:peptidoglycan DD-metalloendopeptidase family protein [Myxococcales bacterium]